KRISRSGLANTQGKILFKFFFQPLLNVSGSYQFPFLTIKRRIVDCEHHAHRWFIDGDGLHAFGFLNIRYRITNLEAFKPYQRTDLTRFYFVYFQLFKTLENVKIFYL